MKLTQQRQIDRLGRSLQFADKYASEFAPNSKAMEFRASLQEVLFKLQQTLSAKPDAKSAAKASRSSQKRDALNALREEMGAIEQTAAAIALIDPEFNNTFVVHDWRRKEQLAATARQFIADAPKVKSRFVEFEMSEDFGERLQEKLDAYLAMESGKGPKEQGSGHGNDDAVTSLIDECEKLAGYLDVVMTNKYRGNAEVLDEWQQASAVEITKLKKGK